MLRARLRFIIYIFIFSGSRALFALDGLEGDPVVVKATSMENDSLESHGSTTVLSLSEDNPQQKDLSRILEKETSVRIKRYGGKGYLSTISIRGSNPNQVPVYLDGIPLFNSVTGDVNLEDLDAENLERIEIHRSGDGGGSPLGGSVRLFSRKNFSQDGAFLKFYGGSFHTAGAAAGLQKTGPIRIQANARTEVSDQDFTFHNDNGTPLFNSLDDFDEKRKNTWFRNTFGHIRLSSQFDRTEVFFLNDTTFRRHGVPGPAPRQTEKTKRSLRQNIAGAGTDTRGLFVDNFRLQSVAYYTTRSQDFYDSRNEFRYNRPDSRSLLLQSGIDLTGTLYLEEFQQTPRFEWRMEKERYRNTEMDKLHWKVEGDPPKTRVYTDFLLEDEFSFFRGRFRVTPALDFRSYSDSLEKKYTTNDLEAFQARLRNVDRDYLRYSRDEAMGFSGETEEFRLIDPEHLHRDFVNPSVTLYGVLIKSDEKQQEREGPKGKLYVKAQYGTGKRMPLFVEMFGEAGSITGNPDLNPEESENYEIGTGFRATWKSFRSSLELTAFRRDVRNVILFLPDTPFTLRPENDEGARIRGVEFQTRLDYSDLLSLRAGYTYQKALLESRSSALDGKYLPLRPMHEFAGTLELTPGDFEFDLEVLFTGATFRDRTNEIPDYIPARWRYNASVTWNAGSIFSWSEHENLALHLEIQNIKNEKGTDVSGYPLPGRSVYVSLLFTI